MKTCKQCGRGEASRSFLVKTAGLKRLKGITIGDMHHGSRLMSYGYAGLVTRKPRNKRPHKPSTIREQIHGIANELAGGGGAHSVAG